MAFRPSVLCTSGSAPAHFLPAIAEAFAACIPLIALTADRPTELHDCGAAQTMDQLKLFGGQVRRFFELGEPNESDLSLRALRRSAAHAVFATRFPTPGPVHINVRVRKPLEPFAPVTQQDHQLAQRVADLCQRPLVTAAIPRVVADDTTLDRIATKLASCARGIVLAGPIADARRSLVAPLFELARRLDYPLFAEATSQLRFNTPEEGRELLCGGFDRLLQLETFCRDFEPELVLQIGSTPTSSSWERFAGTLAHSEVIVLEEHTWRDPASRATQHVFGELEHTVDGLLKRARELPMARSAARLDYRRGVMHAEGAVWRATERLFALRPALCEGAVARSVVEHAPLGSSLFIGNSLPLRHLDGFCPSSSSRLRVLFQRGLNGIDGSVAGAAGSAQVSPAATTLLIGDLTLQHDIGSLALVDGKSDKPFVVVVLQNCGGRIFELLPFARQLREHEAKAVFAEGCSSFEAAATLYGARYERVEGERALQQALRHAYLRPGLTLIEAVVPPHGAAEDERFIMAELRAELGLRKAS